MKGLLVPGADFNLSLSGQEKVRGKPSPGSCRGSALGFWRLIREWLRGYRWYWVGSADAGVLCDAKYIKRSRIATRCGIWLPACKWSLLLRTARLYLH